MDYRRPVLATIVLISITFAFMEVPPVVVVPTVIVFQTPAITIPVTREKGPAVMPRRDPTGSFVRRSSPVAFVPPVPASDWVPIAFYPHKSLCWSHGPDAYDSRSRWRTDLHRNRHLSAQRPDAGQEHSRKQCRL
jgi:hypothetical protein